MDIQPRTFVLLQKFLPKRLITWLAGYIGQIKIRFVKNYLINRFIQQYGIEMNQYKGTNANAYVNFNEFFTRELINNARPMTAGKSKIISPVDGRISEIGRIETKHLLQAKSHYFTLDKLLVNDQQMYQKYFDGRFVTIYLAPSDYHRIHMPFDGTLNKTIYVPGKFFSVNQETTQEMPNLYVQNERLICEFITTHNNQPLSMLMILVGAMVVSGIETVWKKSYRSRRIRIQGHRKDNIHLNKSEEMGRFNIGSTVILIFPPGCSSWAPSLKAGSYVKMGRMLGDINLNQ